MKFSSLFVLFVSLLLTSSFARGAPENQQRAFDLIDKLGGKLTVETSEEGKPVLVLSLWAVGGVTEAQLKTLSVLKGVQRLDLTGNGITDQDLVVIAEFRQLESLSLGGSLVTDAGLRELVCLKGLRE